jgi:hypothetical protein
MERSKKSVRLSPSVEALECRKLLSGPGPGTPPAPLRVLQEALRQALSGPEPGTPPVPDMAVLPEPLKGTEVIKAHKVVAFHVQFPGVVNLPPTGDIQQFSLETAGSTRRHPNADGPVAVPLASATYNQANGTETLTPTSPAPVGKYRLVTQASLNGSVPPYGQATWTTLVRPSNRHPSDGSSSDGPSYAWLTLPVTWPVLLSH